MKILVLGPDDGWHADQLRQAVACAGDRLTFATYESLRSSIAADGCPQWVASAGPLNDFDVVLTRTMPTGSLEQITFRLNVLHSLQRAATRVVNPPAALEMAIDKYACTMRLCQLGYRVPATIVCQTRTDAMQAFEKMQTSVVVKPVFGGEGRGVMLVETPELAWTTFSTLQQLGAIIYQQQYIPSGGRDLRLLVVGETIWTLQRTNPNDWRTNVSRGASTTQISVTDELRTMATTICQSMRLVIAGIDLIQDADGNWYVLEVNGVPGWKGAQGVISENIAAHIIESLRTNVC